MNIYIYLPSKMTPSPYTSFWGGKAQSMHGFPFLAVKPGQPSTEHTIPAHDYGPYQGNITRNSFLWHSKLCHPASYTLPSLAHIDLNCRILLAELDITFSAFSVFTGRFPTQLTHQVDISKRKKNKPG